MLRALCLIGSFYVLGCGGGSSATSTVVPHAPQTAPTSQSERFHALQSFAQRAFEVLQTRQPIELVFDDAALHRLLNSVAASRAAAQRNAMQRFDGVAPAAFGLLRNARFAGACFQGVRDEPVGTLLGLTRPGWVFERMLLVAEEGTGRIAIWVEGEFLWTDSGFGAISIQHVETPRRNHADLELAVCDVDLGVHQPLDIVGSGTINH